GAVFTDPSLEIYKAAQLERGFWKTVNLGGAIASVGAMKRGFRQGKTQGDATQQGGVLVVGKDGSVVLHHISRYPGDNAKPADIVHALGEQR
ncbi:MAG: AhpC/TSA family protein, partial [Acidobacteriota bacterium]